MSIITDIQKMKEHGLFENYIDFIQFPIFKNLEENSRINFEFPLTVLVGKNGSNKSSVLTALYGAPYGYSTGTYWFSTATDPIDEDIRGRNRFFYQYTQDHKSVPLEVLKQRTKRSETEVKKGDPDYWEPADPVISIGMQRSVRNDPVKKTVVYIDFRGEISAFDKFFYFGEPKNEKKQNYLRRKSIYLKRAFDGKNPRYRGPNSKKALINRIELKKEELQAINKILNKSYNSIIIVEHKFFKEIGTSIKMSTKQDLKYSEANAGSGEIAVIQLVHKVMNAIPYSLILLDEPEVSLHPSAQKEIQKFLLEEIKKKKHQVILSTHSPAIIKDLPPTAIKLFTTNDAGYFHIGENIDYRTAFYELEDYISNKKMIICEDIDAQSLIKRALAELNLSEYFTVQFAHGGADTIMNYLIPTYAMDPNMCNDIFVIFDGDKYCESYNTNEFTYNDRTNVEVLEQRIKSAYSGNKLHANVDGGKSGGRVDQKCDVYLKYLNYHYNNVGYLPNRKIPEEIVLSSQYVKERFGDILKNISQITSNNAKDILYQISKKRNDKDINSTFESLSYELFAEDSDDLSELKALLSNIFNSNNVKLETRSIVCL